MRAFLRTISTLGCSIIFLTGCASYYQLPANTTQTAKVDFNTGPARMGVTGGGGYTATIYTDAVACANPQNIPYFDDQLITVPANQLLTFYAWWSSHSAFTLGYNFDCRVMTSFTPQPNKIYNVSYGEPDHPDSCVVHITEKSGKPVKYMIRKIELGLSSVTCTDANSIK